MKIFTGNKSSRIFWPVLQKALLPIVLILLSMLPATTQAQCNSASSFTKITNTGGTATYPGTNGSPSVSVTTTATGQVSTFSFCSITNGFRAGVNDNNGSFRFAFSPAVNGIAINLNALSNNGASIERVRIRINNVMYNVTAGNITCSGTCFSCAGTGIAASGGFVTAAVDAAGNGTGQLLIQGAGLISSIEYVNEALDGQPQGSIFEIFFNNSSCILPVVLSNFTATGPQLSWTAATEQHVRHYEVERSIDGLTFTTVARVPAKGGGNYLYTDNEPATGLHYYRLKIVDADGSYQYSTIVKTNLQGAGTKRIWMNPATGALTITGLSGTSHITIYTATGQKLTQQTTSNTSENIATDNWPTGMYIVRVQQNGGSVVTSKVVK